MSVKRKLVLRALPEYIGSSELEEYVAPFNESLEYLRFCPKYNVEGAWRPARAYVRLVSLEKAVQFIQYTLKTDAVDANGETHRLVVEYAPYQEIPLPAPVEALDSQGTIDDAEDFIALKSLYEELGNLSVAKMKEKVVPSEAEETVQQAAIIEYLKKHVDPLPDIRRSKKSNSRKPQSMSPRWAPNEKKGEHQKTKSARKRGKKKGKAGSKESQPKKGSFAPPKRDDFSEILFSAMKKN